MNCELCGGAVSPDAHTCAQCGAPVNTAPDSLALPPGHVLNGRFTIRRILGEGGFGITYAAYDRTLETDVAIKELLPPGSRRNATGHVVTRTNAPIDVAVQRFIREAQALRAMNHNSIVRVFDFFEANNTGYLVMELLPGETLEMVLLREPRWDESRTLALVKTLSGALTAIHASGFLHRDIKPANIMVVPHRGPVLIDFGSARLASANHTSALTAVVTHGYAPLEQYASQGRIGPTADLYSAGAVLFEVLVGHPPAPAADRANHDDTPSLSALRPDLLTGLGAAVDAALALRPTARPQSVEDFVALINRPAAAARASNPPPRPTPPVVITNTPSKTPRSRTWIALAALAALIASVAAVATLTRHDTSTEAVETSSAADATNAADPTTPTAPTIASDAAETTAPAPTSKARASVPIAVESNAEPAAMFRSTSARIGLFFDGSVPSSLNFANAAKAAQLAAARSGGPSPKLISCDTASQDPITCATRWSTDPTIIGVVGPTSSAVADKLSALYDAGTPVLIAGATRRSLTVPRRSPAIFRLTPSDYRLGQEAGRLAMREGGSKAWVVRPDSLTGAELLKSQVSIDGFFSGFTRWRLGASGGLPPTDPTMTAPDVVFLDSIDGPGADAVLAELNHRRWRGTMVASFEIFQGSFAGTGCASGRIRCYAIDSGIAAVPKRYGLALSAAGYPAAEATSWSVTGYDAYLILVASTATMLAVPDQSVRLADVWSSIAHKLGSTSPTGSAGRYSFDANGDSLLNAFVVFRKTAKSWAIV